MTLPSYLDGSSGSQEAESDRELQWDFQFPNSCDSSSFALVKIYHEMMTIHKQLKVCTFNISSSHNRINKALCPEFLNQLK